MKTFVTLMYPIFGQIFVRMLYTIFITFKAIGGLLADARAMADYAREECSNFRSNFGIPIPLHVCISISFLHFSRPVLQLITTFLMKHLSDRLSAYMHAHTLLGSIRPFGCSLILSSYEALPQNKQSVPQLFMIDPSGLSNVLHCGPVACLAIYVYSSQDSIWLRVTLAVRWANPGNLRRQRSRRSRHELPTLNPFQCGRQATLWSRGLNNGVVLLAGAELDLQGVGQRGCSHVQCLLVAAGLRVLF